MKKGWFFPKTKLGKWSVLLIILFFLMLFVFWVLVGLVGMRGGETFFSNIPLALTGISMAILGISSFFTGIISIIKKKERAVLVFISTVIGLFILWFVSAELLFPH